MRDVGHTPYRWNFFFEKKKTLKITEVISIAGKYHWNWLLALPYLGFLLTHLRACYALM